VCIWSTFDSCTNILKVNWWNYEENRFVHLKVQKLSDWISNHLSGQLCWGHGTKPMDYPFHIFLKLLCSPCIILPYILFCSNNLC
jgi:hypothetical protein